MKQPLQNDPEIAIVQVLMAAREVAKYPDHAAVAALRTALEKLDATDPARKEQP